MDIKTLAPGVAIIGRFMPDPTLELTHASIHDGIEEQVPFLNKIHADVRDPKLNNELKSQLVASNWHRDVSYSWHSELAMVVWSNREQTEIQLPDGTVIEPEPYDIVAIHNDKVMHKTPSRMSEDRWFFRAHLRAPEWL